MIVFSIFILCCVSITCGQNEATSERNVQKHNTFGNILTTKLGNNFYKFHQTHMCFYDAKKICSIEGGTLLFPENEDDVMLVKTFWFITLHGSSSEGIMLGIKRPAHNLMPTSDVNTLSDTMIFRDSPLGVLNPADDNKDCLGISFTGPGGLLQMQLISCNRGHPFICKIPDTINTPETTDSAQNTKVNLDRSDYHLIPDTNYVYKLHDTHATFYEAKTTCEREGATLFYAESEREAKAVVSYWNNLPGGYFRQGSILGLRRSIDGGFKSIDTGVSITSLFNNWRSGEPNNSNGNEDCVGMSYTGDVVWMNDIPCSTKDTFICKAPANSDISTKPTTTPEPNPSITEPNSDRRRDYNLIPGTNYVYKLHDTHATFYEAKTTCEREGATLFYAESEREAKTVVSYYNNIPGGYFLSGSIMGLLRSDDDDFKSIDKGVSITKLFNVWRQGEPNNSNNDENCVAMSYTGDTVWLNDIPCSTKDTFICKVPVGKTPCKMPSPDSGYVEYLGKLYKLHTARKTWSEARRVCQSENADLAVINSLREVAYLSALATQAAGDQRPQRRFVLLGYRYGVEDWETIEGTPLAQSGYTNWSWNQPSGGNSSLCGAMFYNGELNSVSCSVAAPFMCEAVFCTE